MATSTGAASETTSTSTSTAADGDELTGESTWGSPDCADAYEGDLTITDDTDVDALRQTYRVEGSLIVYQTSFESLEFLACLERIDGGLEIRGNANLVTVAGLERLESVSDPATPASTINVVGNPLLVDVEPLGAVRELFRLDVSDNESLTNLGLNGLETLQDLEMGGCHQEGEPPVGDNPSLSTIEGLESLQFLRDLHVGSQGSLTSLGTLHDFAMRGEFGGVAFFWANTSLPFDEIEAFLDEVGDSPSDAQCGNLQDPEGPCEICPFK